LTPKLSLDQVNGEHVGSFHGGISLLKGLPVDAMATLTLLRESKANME
jgi:hypothetical protein